MKRLIFIVVVLLVGVVTADFRYDSTAEYDVVIKHLETQIKELKVERKEVRYRDEKSTFISVWALWKAGEELEYIYPPRSQYKSDGLALYVIKDNVICPQNFEKIIERAEKIDAQIVK